MGNFKNEDKEVKFCLNCGGVIPKIKYDSLGRRNTRTSNYCDNNNLCRNQFIIAKDPEKHKNYMKDYYREHPEYFIPKNKYVKKVKVKK
jgi:hypothetical protein